VENVIIPKPNPVPPKGVPRGKWNAFAEADFDGDGRADVVATSWGRNTPFQAHLRDGIRLFDDIEAYVDPRTRKMVPWRDRETLGAKLPWIMERFPTARAYGEATLEEIFGDKLKAMKQERFDSLDHMVFLNRGDRVDPKPLPIEAQFAPSLAVAVGDIDGDGALDIFLAQNFFAVDAQTSRYDAGRGLCLRGDGRGNFTALSGDESGIKIYGEQTAALLKDFDADGKLDLAVTQKNAETKFYRNVSPKK
jgi:enediyne biosynthesis protein E4